MIDRMEETNRGYNADFAGDDYKVSILKVEKGDDASKEEIEDYVLDYNDTVEAAIDNLNAVSNNLGTDLLGKYIIKEGSVGKGIHVGYSFEIKGSLNEEKSADNDVMLIEIDGAWYVANDDLSSLTLVEQLFYDWQFGREYEK